MFGKIEQDNCFFVKHIDDKAHFSTFIEKKKAGKTTIFLRDIQNYVYRLIYVEYARRILSTLWPYLDISYNVLNNN